jgi:hypothetical protein
MHLRLQLTSHHLLGSEDSGAQTSKQDILVYRLSQEANRPISQSANPNRFVRHRRDENERQQALLRSQSRLQFHPTDARHPNVSHNA